MVQKWGWDAGNICHKNKVAADLYVIKRFSEKGLTNPNLGYMVSYTSNEPLNLRGGSSCSI